ncbi:MAG: 50S ribosomal protein L25 [Candidatus Eremiobacteraeota bacterium]|nr:50S ribosomal protein L25 [Candidatus Eremiobacteraeota bacterium]MBC5827292.1 50S ribosomal protein L25 [Candidatus Eremiobacteraeota bacterium]
MEQVTLAARARTGIGSRTVKKMRQAGKVPGVVYGREFGDAMPIEIDGRELRAALHGHGLHSIINLSLDGRPSTPVLVHDHQVDILTKHLIHVDLHAVSLDEEIESSVQLVPVGTAPGVKEGGILDFVLREVEVACLPGNIPERIEVNVGELQIGGSIHVRDLTVPEGVRIVDSGGEMVVSLLPPSKVEEAPVAEATAAVPELIGAKKSEEEEQAS